MKVFASVIVPVYNQLERTKECLASILHDGDRAPYEIIIIDNASTDGTREYLEVKARELDRSKDRFIQILNKTNLGVAAAWNQGIHAAHGDYLAIINNDVVLTAGWLRSLAWAMENHGLNLVSPFAATGTLDYNLQERARRFCERNLGKIWLDEADFCAVAMPRSTCKLVGLFDEKFIVGGYEDTDYCYRMRELGLRFGVSGAAFIHHYGSSTLGPFKKAGDAHAAKNRDYFISKWNEDPSRREAGPLRKIRRAYRRLKLRWGRM